MMTLEIEETCYPWRGPLNSMRISFFRRGKACIGVSLIVAAMPSSADDFPDNLDFRPLVEVQTLVGLPGQIKDLLGAEKSGADEIADAHQPFDSTSERDKGLPMRQFVVAGVSNTDAVIEYERAGIQFVRGRFVAIAYGLYSTGWKEVGELQLDGPEYTLDGLARGISRQIETEKWHAESQRRDLVGSRILKTQPRRRDSPLRDTNISDDEVREIKAVAQRVLPGSLVNISGVVTGCPCEEGAGCSDQVWAVAYRPGRMKGLQLSKIAGHWAIGSVQQWWLDKEDLDNNKPTDWKTYRTAISALQDRFPACASQTSSSSSTSAAQR